MAEGGPLKRMGAQRKRGGGNFCERKEGGTNVSFPPTLHFQKKGRGGRERRRKRALCGMLKTKRRRRRRKGDPPSFRPSAHSKAAFESWLRGA